jgi:Cu(I)/Ag(I) efflux system membrane fusion protein
MSLIKFTLLPLLFLTVLFGDVQAQHHQHNNHLELLVDQYLAAQKALSVDDFESAHGYLSDFKKEVSENSEMNHHPEHSGKHAKHHGTMVAAVNAASDATDIEKLRKAFAQISDNLVKALRNQVYEGKELFLQYCPEANNGEGAHWISNTKEISNPYLGAQTTDCSVTREKLSSN